MGINRLKIFIKTLVVSILIYLFYNPDMFAKSGYSLAINGIVVCRGFSLLMALNMIFKIADELDESKK